MNDNTFIQLPIEQIAKAIRITKKAKADVLAIEGRVHALGRESDVRQFSGEEGVQKWQAELAAAETERTTVITQAQEKILQLSAEAQEFVNKQTTPDGNDLVSEGAGDFGLLNNGLVTSAEKLQRLVDKHKGSVAFMVAAQQYAAQRNWEGFSYFTKEGSVHEFVAQIFKMLGVAAATPYGVAVVQYTETESEYKRLAAAYDITDEFFASGGEKLTGVISESVS